MDSIGEFVAATEHLLPAVLSEAEFFAGEEGRTVGEGLVFGNVEEKLSADGEHKINFRIYVVLPTIKNNSNRVLEKSRFPFLNHISRFRHLKLLLFRFIKFAPIHLFWRLLPMLQLSH